MKRCSKCKTAEGVVGLSISGEKVKMFCIKCFDLSMKGLWERIKKAGFKQKFIKTRVAK